VPGLISEQDVMLRFKLISSLNEEEAENWLVICSESLEEILNKLKENVNIEENSMKIINAAAALSFYKYSLFKSSSENISAFNAGEFSVKIGSKNKALEIAFKIWQEAKNNINNLISDDNFYFKALEY